MEIGGAVKKALKEIIVPELDKIKADVSETKAVLGVTNKRIDDLSTNLADQSRRIDSMRDELTQRIDNVRDELGQRIDTLDHKIDAFAEKLDQKIDKVEAKLDEKIEKVTEKVDRRFDDSNKRIDFVNTTIVSVNEGFLRGIENVNNNTNTRLDKLFNAVVRRDDHFKLEKKFIELEKEVKEIKEKISRGAEKAI
jgi:DNA anti-recombination protein RmuC